MASEVITILLLVIINGIFSMAEIAIVSSRKSRLEGAAQKGDKGAQIALELANDPNTFLSTVQVGITAIGIVTGVFGGANLSEPLAQLIAQSNIAFLQPYSETIAVATIIIAITFVSLVIGELVPKRLGMQNPEGIAKVMAIPMSMLAKVCSPLVWLLSNSTSLFLKVFRFKSSSEPAVTEEEIKSLVAQGTNMGIFEEVEQEIVDRVFTLSDRRVGSIMTNKLDIEWIDINEPSENIKSTVLQAPYSHFPVCRDTLDDVIGIISTKQFLQTLLQNGTVDLEFIAQKPLFIPESMKAFKVLEQFQQSKNRVAIVVDEFGTVQGLVTLKDLFEAMVGGLEPSEEESYTVVEREDGTYLVDGLMSFEEFLQYFDITDIGLDERAGFHTLGGLIFNIAHEIPKVGERFQWNNMDLEIMDMDGNRIDKVLVRLHQES